MLIAEVTTQRAIGMVVVALVVIGGIILTLWLIAKGRAEVGSEIELAPNRRLDLDDAELEGPRLNKALWLAFGLMAATAIIVPLYWLAEPGREAGAVKDFENTFVERGLDTYVNGAQCQSCHGPKGTGGAKEFVINDENGGYLATVNWAAPALDTVLWRFSVDEVVDVLNYGRPGTPMPAWGTVGGGPLTTQQIDNVISYLWTVQLTPAQMQTQVDDAIKAVDPGLLERLDAVRTTNAKADPRLDRTNNDKYDPTAYECPDTVGTTASTDAAGKHVKFACLGLKDQLRLGEILFNLESTGAGAYGCSRCHVPGASYGKPWQSVEKIGTGRFAPNLIGIEKDLTVKQHFALVVKGSVYGQLYGSNHQGSGRMPGFALNANDGDEDTPQLGKSGMLGPEEAWAIMVYERNLSSERPDLVAAGEDPATTPAGAAPTSGSASPTTTIATGK